MLGQLIYYGDTPVTGPGILGHAEELNVLSYTNNC